MPRHHHIVTVLLVSLISTTGLHTAAAQDYVITELGTLGGATSIATDINNLGVVAGYSTTLGGQTRGFRWENGIMTELGTNGGINSHALGLNDEGYIVGAAQDVDGNFKATQWTPNIGVPVILGTLNQGITSQAWDINDERKVVGVSQYFSQGFGLVNSRAFIYQQLTGIADLGAAGGPTSAAYAISDTEFIVGSASIDLTLDRACRFYEVGGPTVIENGTSTALAVSAEGIAAGYRLVVGGHEQARKWNIFTGAGTTLPNLPGYTDSEAHDIDVLGRAVGRSYTLAGAERATLWTESGQAIDLNDLIPADSGWTLSSATAMNVRGQIVGRGIVGEQTRAFVLTPLFVTAVDPVDNMLTADEVTTSPVRLATSDARHVIGAVCDGVTRVLLRAQNVPGPGTVTFTIQDENGAATVGKLCPPGSSTWPPGNPVGTNTLQVEAIALPTGAYWAFAVWIAPEDFVRNVDDEEEDDRSVFLDVVYTPSGSGGVMEASAEYKLRRPPLLLLHGFRSLADVWELDIQVDEYERWFVHEEDYRRTSLDWLSDNVSVPAAGIAECQKLMRDAGFACTQADVVGHSMGGLLTRLYISEYDGIDYRKNGNYNEGDVNRLITLDTPHFGSPLADIGVALRDHIALLADVEQFFKVFLVGALESSFGLNEGAVDDLQVDSPIIVNLPLATVPCHVIVSVGGSDVLSGQIPGLPTPARLLVQFFGMFGTPHSAIFGLQQHDLVVSRSSQEGGLPTGTSQTSVVGFTTVPEVTWANHLTNVYEDAYSNIIVQLLNDSVNNAFVYATSLPFSGGQREPAAPTVPEFGPVVAGLQFAAPGTPATIGPNQNFSVTVTPINGFSPNRVMVITPYEVHQLTSAPYTVSLHVPTEAVGSFRVSVMAIDATNAIASLESPPIVVQIPEQIISFRVAPAPFNLYEVRPFRHARVYAVYEDFTEREMEGSAFGLTYEINDPAIATVSADGLVSAVSRGTARLTVSNGLVENDIEVHVLSVPCPADITDDGLVNVEDLLAVISAWGVCSGCDADLNGDGFVNVADLLAVINGWGVCP